MNFYRKPLSNFKLECWSIEKELQEEIGNFLDGSDANDRSEIPKLLSAISSMADACLLVILLAPCGARFAIIGAFIFIPLS